MDQGNSGCQAAMFAGYNASPGFSNTFLNGTTVQVPPPVIETSTNTTDTENGDGKKPDEKAGAGVVGVGMGVVGVVVGVVAGLL